MCPRNDFHTPSTERSRVTPTERFQILSTERSRPSPGGESRSRRDVLRGLAATATVGVAGSAGCIDRTDDDADAADDDADAADDDDVHEIGESAILQPDEATVVDTAHVTVESIEVQRSLVIHHVWRSLYEPDEGQLLIVRASLDVEGDDSPRGPTDLRFGATLGDETVGPDADVIDIDGPIAGLNVDAVAVDEGTVRLADGHEPRWRIPERALERLAAVPAFHLHDATVVGEEGNYGLELTVENTGDREGTFRGVVDSDQADDYDEEFAFEVPAGETVTETVRNRITTDWQDDEFVHDVDRHTRSFDVGYA